jgi:hypothetical protein
MTEAEGRGIADAFRSRGSGGGSGKERDQRPATPKRGGGTLRRARRKTGKRSNPDYVQVSALITKDVRAQFAVARAQAAVESGRNIEFGELVNLLLAHFAVGAVNIEELEESFHELRAE